MTVAHAPFWRVWMLAARVPTLPAAIVPVLVGSAVAYHDGSFRIGPFIAALIASLLIQIGTNLANDLFDFRKGADTAARLGPPRVTQSGMLTQGQVAIAAGVVFGLSVLIGLYLVWAGGWPVLVIGVLSIIAGVTYTGGPWPTGYHGLGDLVCFIFFGIVAVTGMYFVHTHTVTQLALAASLPVATLVTAILIVNNLRDIETDRATGKRTLAVMLGRRGTRIEYALCLVVAYLVPLVLWLLGMMSLLWWLSWLTLPLAVPLFRTVTGTTEGPALNKALKGTARLHLLFGLLFAASLLW